MYKLWVGIVHQQVEIVLKNRPVANNRLAIDLDYYLMSTAV